MANINLSIDLIFSSWGSEGKYGMTCAAQPSHSCRLVRKGVSFFALRVSIHGSWGLGGLWLGHRGGFPLGHNWVMVACLVKGLNGAFSRGEEFHGLTLHSSRSSHVSLRSVGDGNLVNSFEVR